MGNCPQCASLNLLYHGLWEGRKGRAKSHSLQTRADAGHRKQEQKTEDSSLPLKESVENTSIKHCCSSLVLQGKTSTLHKV